MGRLPAMPPASMIEQADIRQAVEAHHAAKQAAHAASQTATALEQERPQTLDADALALADAMQAGRPDPGPKHVDRHDEQIADAQRRAAAAQICLDRAFVALAETIAKHEPEWTKLASRRHERPARGTATPLTRSPRHRRNSATRPGSRLPRPGWPLPARRPCRSGADPEGRLAYGPVDVVIAGLRSLGEPPVPQASRPTGLMRVIGENADAA